MVLGQRLGGADVERCPGDRVAIERNAQRPQPVPEKAIRGTKNKWEAPTSGEGFDALYRVKVVDGRPEHFDFDIQELPKDEQDDG